MTKEEYIKAMIARNPALGKADEETVKLTCRGIRALVGQAYDMGFAAAIERKQSRKKTGRCLSSFSGRGWPF